MKWNSIRLYVVCEHNVNLPWIVRAGREFYTMKCTSACNVQSYVLSTQTLSGFLHLFQCRRLTTCPFIIMSAVADPDIGGGGINDLFWCPLKHILYAFVVRVEKNTYCIQCMLTTTKVYPYVLCSQNLQKQPQKYFQSGGRARCAFGLVKKLLTLVQFFLSAQNQTNFWVKIFQNSCHV